MRILQVITDRDRRGAQVFATDLGEGMTALGHSVTTVALVPGRFGDLLPIEALGPSRWSRQTIRRLRNLAGDHDVVIAHGSATLATTTLGLLGSRTPIVYRQISDPLFWAASWPRRLRVAAFLRRVKAVVALSPGVADVFRRHYWLSERKVDVVPNAVPGERFRPPSADQRASARRDLGLETDRPSLLYVGALAEEKGVDIAIEAMAGLDVDLVIAGTGPERERLEERAIERAPGRVHFVGSLDDARTAYWASDVLLLPSRGGDSMPAVLIEAGLCGLPAVSTPVGAIPDVVVEGRTGRIVPIGDQDAFSAATRDLVERAAERLAFGSAAVEHCRERFTIEQVAPQWILTIDRVRSRRKRADL